MIYKSLSPVPDQVRVVFELPACLWADQIFLVGDFNGWDLGMLPLHQEHDGRWRAAVDLPYGCRCEFRYFVDGRWLTDAHADDFTTNIDGTTNSVVEACLPAEELVLESWKGEMWNGHMGDVALQPDSESAQVDDNDPPKNPAYKVFTLTMWQIVQRSRVNRRAERGALFAK
jgi:hypothetical protein